MAQVLKELYKPPNGEAEDENAQIRQVIPLSLTPSPSHLAGTGDFGICPTHHNAQLTADDQPVDFSSNILKQ